MNLERSALRLGALCGANHKWNEMVPEFPHIGFTRAGIEYGSNIQHLANYQLLSDVF